MPLKTECRTRNSAPDSQRCLLGRAARNDGTGVLYGGGRWNLSAEVSDSLNGEAEPRGGGSQGGPWEQVNLLAN